MAEPLHGWRHAATGWQAGLTCTAQEHTLLQKKKKEQGEQIFLKKEKKSHINLQLLLYKTVLRLKGTHRGEMQDPGKTGFDT